MLSWALEYQAQHGDKSGSTQQSFVTAAFGASLVTRYAQKAAFEKCGRSMLAEDVIDQLGHVIDSLYGK